MKIPLKEIAQLIQGEIFGNQEVIIETFSPIESAGEGCITFFANPLYEDYVYTMIGGVIITSKLFQPNKPIHTTLLKVDDVQSTLSFLLEKLQSFSNEKIGIENPSFIGEKVAYGENFYLGAFSYIGTDSNIGNNVKIYPGVYIGDSSIIGDNSILYAGCKVYHNTIIGKNCIIHSGAIIGADGFGFAPQKDGSYKKIPQIGNVILEDNVEVGANTTIDRAALSHTILKKGVKLDNLIQVAHNVVIGENTVIAAQTGISGSTKIGKQSMIGGQVGIVGHIELAENTHIGAQSGVSKGIKTSGTKLFGSPALPYRESIKRESNIKEIDGLRKRIEELETIIKQLLKN